MAKYSNPSFEIDLFVNGEFREVKVTLELCASGSYDEPMLEEDGAALIEVVNSKGDLIRGTCEISITELDSLSRKRLSEAIANCIYKTEENYFSEISQDLAERAADRYHDMLEDR